MSRCNGDSGAGALVRICVLAAAVSGLQAQGVDGLWQAAVKNPAGGEVGFTLSLRSGAGGLHGDLVNGADRIPSTAGYFRQGRLLLSFRDWDGVLEARLDEGKLRGSFIRRYRKRTLVREFFASRAAAEQAERPTVEVSGEWMLSAMEEGKTIVYRALLRQSGARLEGTLAPVSGDWGAMAGTVRQNKITLSRFDGIRALLLEASIEPDGLLKGTLNSMYPVTGRRHSQSAVETPDALHYTRLRTPGEPFRFSFPDLNGNIVSNEDARFQGKVLLLTITGSWCPNCHEEAPLLGELYERYKPRGLEIVALGFEYTGERDRDLRQLRRFAGKHRIAYPVLLAGTTEEAEEKLPQLENFGAYPTTIFIGRDGQVRAIHAGFDGPSTGLLHQRLREEMKSLIEKLLAE
ncbi:MAG: TlpA family protein disulfide reductase [Bryobacterales bacterium]|nr:TlpA family protein disulfide reductase [Bryobacterales bacterium]